MSSLIEIAISKLNCSTSTKNTKKTVNESKTKPINKESSNAAAYMIGATAIATVVALGIAGRKGKLGNRLQELLEGKAKNINKPNPNVTSEANVTSQATQTITETVLTPQQKAKQTLAKLYEKVINKAKLDGNQKRVDIFEQAKISLENMDKETVYGNLLEALYKDLRLADYPLSHIKTQNIEQITGKGNSLMRVNDQNGWHYRMPNIRQGNRTIDRVSVNAVADENLIKALDDLFGTGKVKGYYKTPDMGVNWLERHDPITIYLDEKATPETLKNIKTTCEKFIRSTNDVLSGDKFAPGFALQKSPDAQDIETLLSKAKNIDPALEKVLRTNFTRIETGELKTSAGYMDAAKKIIESIQ